MKISQIVITEKCIRFLKRKNLVKKWKKAKEYLLSGDLSSVDFKKRRPYKSEKYYFRLDKQYRAIGFFEDTVLYIFEIDDHQQ